MTLQRRLSGMERDLAAIQARISSLESEANAIEDTHPEEAALIRERVTLITDNWHQLTQMVCFTTPNMYCASFILCSVCRFD